MGSISSKFSSRGTTAAKNGVRKFPSRVSPHDSVAQLPPGPAEQTNTNASKLNELKHSRYLGLDATLNQRLRQLGPVDPYPKSNGTSGFKMATTHLRSPNLLSHSHLPQTSESTLAGTKIAAQSQDSHLLSRDLSISSSTSAPIFPDANVLSNPAISLLATRNRMDAEAEAEFSRIGKSADKGRQFLDVEIIRQILTLRDTKGMGSEEIEKRLGLRSRVVAVLGHKGVVGVE